MDPTRLLLERLLAGELSVTEAAAALAPPPSLGFATPDPSRAARTGADEVIFAPGKTHEQLLRLLQQAQQRGLRALATRVDATQARFVQAQLPLAYDPVARLLWTAPEGHDPFAAVHPGELWVVSAGTGDRPVAMEAAQVARWHGLHTHTLEDVGVAGLQRLLDQLNTLRRAQALIVVAGMEGALPAVVAGLVSAPVIAVPTSVGYGAHLGGFTPLLAMLDGCAEGVGVVNIDNGFGAAMLARRIMARP